MGVKRFFERVADAQAARARCVVADRDDGKISLIGELRSQERVVKASKALEKAALDIAAYEAAGLLEGSDRAELQHKLQETALRLVTLQRPASERGILEKEIQGVRKLISKQQKASEALAKELADASDELKGRKPEDLRALHEELREVMARKAESEGEVYRLEAELARVNEELSAQRRAEKAIAHETSERHKLEVKSATLRVKALEVAAITQALTLSCDGDSVQDAQERLHKAMVARISSEAKCSSSERELTEQEARLRELRKALALGIKPTGTALVKKKASNSEQEKVFTEIGLLTGAVKERQRLMMFLAAVSKFDLVLVDLDIGPRLIKRSLELLAHQQVLAPADMLEAAYFQGLLRDMSAHELQVWLGRAPRVQVRVACLTDAGERLAQAWFDSENLSFDPSTLIGKDTAETAAAYLKEAMGLKTGSAVPLNG